MILTAQEKEVFADMVKCNLGVTEEQLLKGYTHYRFLSFRYFAQSNPNAGYIPPLVDISPLSRLKDLEEISLDNCAISNLSPLCALHKLNEISVYGNTVEIEPCDFRQLNNLMFLHLCDGRIGIPKLDGLPNLKHLSLSGIGMEELPPLQNLPALSILSIDKNPNLSDLSPLSSCQNLEKLIAYDTAITDLSQLKNLPKLREITLSGTKVTDVSALAQLPTLEMIWLYDTPVEDVSCLAALPKLDSLNLLKTNVTDLSAFCGREKIIIIERKKLGIGKNQKTSAEIKQKAAQLKEKAEKMGISLNPCLKRTQVKAFEESYGVKLPKEYKAYLTQIGNGFDGENAISPLEQAVFAPERITKRFNFREAWIWENDEKVNEARKESALQNGQLQLADMGDGRSYRLIVCGSAKGEVWEMTDIGISPHKSGGDFLDWLEEFLDEEFTF